MSKTKYPSKTDKAQALIDAGHVRLFPGRGYATVTGSTGSTYTITRQDGCNCPNSKSRDPRSCYHAEAARILCEAYRSLAAQARETGRVTIPPTLGRALGMYRDVAAEADTRPICPAHGDPLPCHWCREEAFERDMRTRCHSCGDRLADGYCPREASERLEAA